jgi:hypothetical protein
VERQRFMIAAATAAAAAVATAVPEVALAQSQPGSNESLRETRANISAIIDDLEFDPGVYGGHRVAAIDAFKAAHEELTKALKYRRKTTRNTALADDNIQRKIGCIDNAIPALQNDSADYGGHKEQAIADLQQAKSELQAALAKQ